MKRRDTIFEGFHWALICDEAGVSKASLYKWAKGYRGKFVAPRIEEAIENLKNKSEDERD